MLLLRGRGLLSSRTRLHECRHGGTAEACPADLVDHKATRGDPLPPGLFGRELLVVETPNTGTSALPSDIPAGSKDVQASVPGSITFETCFEYRSFEEWAADEDHHGVPLDDANFKFTSGKPKFGWVVSRAQRFDRPQPLPAMQRRMRSLFECADSAQPATDKSSDDLLEEQIRLQAQESMELRELETDIMNEFGEGGTAEKAPSSFSLNLLNCPNVANCLAVLDAR